MAKSKKRTAIMAGSPYEVRLIATLGVILVRIGEDATHDEAGMTVMLMVDGEEQLIERVQRADDAGELRAVSTAFAKAIARAAGAEDIRPQVMSSRGGRA